MDGWMEYWTSERAEELRQEAHQARLVRDLKGRPSGRASLPFPASFGLAGAHGTTLARSLDHKEAI
jgi:hypothetical protein